MLRSFTPGIVSRIVTPVAQRIRRQTTDLECAGSTPAGGTKAFRSERPIPPAARLVQISMPYATFAVAFADGVIVAAAPIAQWAVGKDVSTVKDYYQRKGAVFAHVPGTPG